MTNTRRPERAFIGTAVLVFTASTAVPIAWCSSMSAMPGMEMPGGWTMSMAWMRMPGQSWAGAAGTFLGMWAVMMIAMMLPVLASTLMHYCRTWNGFVVGAGYFLSWTAFGAIVYAVGVAAAAAAMALPPLARATPIVLGLVVMTAGLFQFTAWKARQIACCRAKPAQVLCPDTGTAFRHGLKLGILCIRCCLGPTAILLCLGVMNPRAMAIVTAAIALERLSRDGQRFARVTGAAATLAGISLVGHAIL